MTKVFIQQPKVGGAEGEMEFVAVDVATLPLTKDDIREAEPFKEVLSESIQRREELKKLKKGAKATDDGSGEPDGQEGNGKPVEASAEAGGNAPALNVDTIYAEVKSRLAADQAAVVQAAQAQSQRIQAAVEKHKLLPEDVPMLQASNDPDALGAYLARNRSSFAALPVDEKADYRAATKRAFENLGLTFPEDK